jgi:hypothetical protein
MTAPDAPSATLAAIRAIEQAATPGEWQHRTAQTRGDWAAVSKVMPIERIEADARPGGIGIVDASVDAEFIAMARTAIPSLAAAAEAVLKQADHFASEADRFGKLSETADEESGAAFAALAAWQAYDRCAKTFREAITSALTGEASEA